MADSKKSGRQQNSETLPERRQNSSLQRHPFLYVFSIVILVIIVVTFVGAPAVSTMSPSGRLVFGSYAGEEIVYRPGNFFARQYEAIAQSIRQRGSDLDLELQMRLAWREAFNRTVLHTAVLNLAENSDMGVSEAKVDELIATDPQFQTNGRFDSRRYANLSNQEQFNIRQLYRENEIFDRFVQDVLSTPVSGQAEREFVASMAGPERSLNVVQFPLDEYPEEQVRVYAMENLADFTSVELEILTVGTENEAEQVLEQAQTGTPFPELARQYSDDAYSEEGGAMGTIRVHELKRQLRNSEADLGKIMSLPADATSEPVETTNGWSLFHLVSAPEPFDPEAEGSLDEVRTYMETYERGEIQDYWREEAQSFAQAARATNFSAAAADVGLEVLRSGFFALNYGNIQYFAQLQSEDIPALADAAYREDFLEAAFSIQEGDVSEPFVFRQSVLVFSLNEQRPVRDRSKEFIVDYYDSIRRQFGSQAIEDTLIDQDRLEDNFNRAFSRYVLGNGS